MTIVSNAIVVSVWFICILPWHQVVLCRNWNILLNSLSWRIQLAPEVFGAGASPLVAIKWKAAAWPRTCCALCLCLCVGDSGFPARFQGLSRPFTLQLLESQLQTQKPNLLRSSNLGSIFLTDKSFLCSFHPGQRSPHVSLSQKWYFALLG